MKLSRVAKKIVIWMLVLSLALPLPLFAQQDMPAAPKKFKQEQLDQILAPIALYPDPLLAQVLMAATYPLEVVLADRWVKQNGELKGDALNDALDQQSWDPSVKALIPFPAVLTMMSEKLDWTRMVGDAFLSQEGDVMDTVQQLRQKAYAANNLKTTDQQQIIPEQDAIRIEPVNPEVVYVPVYDPWWVYGPWWWTAYPPFIIYPFYPGVVITPGIIWFGSACFVGARWGHAWGHWGWGQHRVFVNVNRNININRANISISNMKTTTWVHDPAHRRGVAYPNRATRERFGQVNRSAVESRRSFRGFEGNPQGTINPAGPRTGVGNAAPGQQAVTPGAGSRRSASPGTFAAPVVPQANISRPTGQGAGRVGGESRPSAFTGIGQGHEVRRQSTWGGAARSGSAPSPSTTGGAVQSSPGSVTHGGTSGGGSHGGHH